MIVFQIAALKAQVRLKMAEDARSEAYAKKEQQRKEEEVRETRFMIYCYRHRDNRMHTGACTTSRACSTGVHHHAIAEAVGGEGKRN